MTQSIIYTIGHSNHTTTNFLEMLATHFVDAVADVRSQPYSKFSPHFGQGLLRADLKKQGIAYVFLGKELGARSTDPSCYVNGKVQYQLLAQTDLYKQGINRLLTGMKSYTIALMCAESDPINCHRSILIGRHFRSSDVTVRHILPNGKIEEASTLEQRLLRSLKMPQKDLFLNQEQLIELAYDRQVERIAYAIDNSDTTQERY
jgi:uncharacterized protein (DUF488 family)